MDQGSLNDQDAVSSIAEDVKDGQNIVESSDTLLPEETLNRKESVELWKSKNETDVIGMLLFVH